MNSGVGEYWHSLILLIWVCLLQLNCLWKCCSCCLFFYIWLLFHCDHLLPSPSPISNGSINCIEFVLHLLSYMQNLSYHLFALLWLLTSGIPPTLWATQSVDNFSQQCCHQWPFLTWSTRPALPISFVINVNLERNTSTLNAQPCAPSMVCSTVCQRLCHKMSWGIWTCDNMCIMCK